VHSTKLNSVLWISAFVFGILVSFQLPVARTAFLWATFVAGEVLFAGGVLVAAIGAGLSIRNHRIAKESIFGGFSWLREVVAGSSHSDLVLWGLVANWVGALLYPALLILISLTRVGGTYGASVAGILIIDVVITFVLRIPLLWYVLHARSVAPPISSEGGASV
jgi:hypothetical protein